MAENSYCVQTGDTCRSFVFMAQSNADVATKGVVSPPAPTCWTSTCSWGCTAGNCALQWLHWLLALLMAGGKRAVHVFVPCMCITPKVERMVVNRIKNRGALAFEMMFVTCLLIAVSLAHLGFHTWAHLPALRQAGFMPEPPARNASALSAASSTGLSTTNTPRKMMITDATSSTQEATRVSLALAIGDSLLDWLSPRRIDIIQRCTYSCFFLASGFAVWLFLCASCAIRHSIDSQVPNADALQDDARWWWVPCHQAIMHLSGCTVLNLGLYTLRAAFIKPWEGWDAALYGLQAWYVLLVIGFQWCALGGLNRHQPICSRMITSPKHFFLEELLSAGGTFTAALFMVAWLCIPVFAPAFKPDLDVQRPELPTGCRLSWQSDPHSWYSCSSLANATTHHRIIVSLLFMALGALGSVVWAFACYCTAIAGDRRKQQTWEDWARHLWSALTKGLSTMSQIALRVMTRQAGFQLEAQDVQQQAAAGEQQQAVQVALNAVTELGKRLEELSSCPPVEVQDAMPYVQQHFTVALQQLVAVQAPGADPGCMGTVVPYNAEAAGQCDARAQAKLNNTAFAEYWWRHTAAAYLGMGFHGAYCMVIVLLQGQQINPYSLQHESSFVHGVAVALLLLRTYCGVMAWRTVAQVHDHVD